MKASFTPKWSRKFLQHRASATPKTVHKWCDQLLTESGHCNWMRLIFLTWYNQNFHDDQVAHACIKWLDQVCMHPAFLKTRGANDLSAGAQIWLSHQEDLMAIQVCQPDLIINTRWMDAQLAVQDWKTHWSKTMGTP